MFMGDIHELMFPVENEFCSENKQSSFSSLFDENKSEINYFLLNVCDINEDGKHHLNNFTDLVC